jgi:hypothetical protein
MRVGINLPEPFETERRKFMCSRFGASSRMLESLVRDRAQNSALRRSRHCGTGLAIESAYFAEEVAGLNESECLSVPAAAERKSERIPGRPDSESPGSPSRKIFTFRSRTIQARARRLPTARSNALKRRFFEKQSWKASTRWAARRSSRLPHAGRGGRPIGVTKGGARQNGAHAADIFPRPERLLNESQSPASSM